MPDDSLVLIDLREFSEMATVKQANGDIITHDCGGVGFFLHSGDIFIFVGQHVSALSNVVIQDEQMESGRRFAIRNGSEVLFEHEYEPEPIEPGAEWFFPVQQEDLDPFMWMATVLNSPERIRVIKETRIQQKNAHYFAGREKCDFDVGVTR